MDASASARAPLSHTIGARRVARNRAPPDKSKEVAMLRQSDLTAAEQKLDAVWNEHLRAEFSAHSADETVATMVADPLINQVPVMIGGDGKEEVHEFYAKY